MTPEEARGVVLAALRQTAPEVDVGKLDPDAPLRETVELDSLDFENFVVQLSEGAGRRIEEDDYPRLATMTECVRFLADGGDR
ncbi:acyl carrier protein [Actinopolymorpha cephalotaxi]|uniref:Acyl carrier protein n=1 Tax=Actinopolymorpha cephalotaxi TaxID=504797 RepID=A0A1I2XQF5_9ACTN|nr:hypothetical protein [Actinopolymorpha cephalotaxi]NYH87133.1 acyl carrier protein [Actinopolymorpha cephalotaxi]SFH15724.1 acyl carrier protein [Actinopolymorpha cephalotaxi]